MSRKITLSEKLSLQTQLNDELAGKLREAIARGNHYSNRCDELALVVKAQYQLLRSHGIDIITEQREAHRDHISSVKDRLMTLGEEFGASNVRRQGNFIQLRQLAEGGLKPIWADYERCA